MKEIRWNLLKGERLKRIRGVSFEEIITGKLIDVLVHPTRDNQQIMLFEYKNYIWVVPFVEADDHIFLKTAYPSRKLTKIYKKETEK